MQLEKNLVEVQRSGNFSEKTFGIKASAQAFDILSSKLYQNIHKAIIRELSTNALDAHREVGKENEPFQVVLPNALSPNLIIRDFGPGLSRDQVMQIYTTYFESTRSDSNYFTGALGLGSKSPFSYTESFIVTSRNNGRKTVYSMFKNEEGFPSVAVLHDEESNEPSGLEINIPVKPHDCDKFYSAVKDVYKFFKVIPTISGREIDLSFSKRTPILEGKGWKLYEGHHGAYAIMGDVGYEINRYEDEFSSSRVGDGVKNLLYKDIHIEFKIGDLDVAASREDLHYSKKTTANIVHRVCSIIAEMNEIISKKFEDAESEWEILCTYHRLCGESGPLNSIAQVVKSIAWRGIKVPHNKVFTQIDGLSRLVKVYIPGWRTKVKYTYYAAGEDCNLGPWAEEIYFNDLGERNGTQRVAKVVKDLKTERTNADPHDGRKDVVFVILDGDKERILSSLEKQGLPRKYIKMTSSLPKVAVTRTATSRAKGIPRKEKGFRFKGSNKWRAKAKDYWTEVDLDPNIPQIYALLIDYNVAQGDQEKRENNHLITPAFVGEVITAIHKITGKEIEVYGLTFSNGKKFIQNAPGWINIRDYAKKVLEEHISKDDNLLIEQITDLGNPRLWKSLTTKTMDVEFWPLKRIAKGLTLVKLDEHGSLENRDTGVATLQRFSGAIIPDDIKEKMNDHNLTEEIIERYPMVRFVSLTDWGPNIEERAQAVADYIRLVEREKKEKENG